VTGSRNRVGEARQSLLRRAAEEVRRAFSEFLTIPTVIIAGFLLLAAAMYQIDHVRMAERWPALMPGDHESIRTLLGTIATSIITVTSITFSLLLLAVQQGAASLTAQVYDQFLRRRANQAYFGFFIGLALYALVVLATVHPGYTPVYSAVLGFVLTAVALYLLILLIYSTIDQMRPVTIVQNIRDHTIAARHRQCEQLRRAASAAQHSADHATNVEARESGYLASFDAAALAEAVRECGDAREIVIRRHVGDYISVGEVVAELRFAARPTDLDLDPVHDLLRLEEQRDLVRDPAFGIDQLVTIGWTAGSTSKSNPHPAILACWNLRDLVASWYPGAQDEAEESAQPDGARVVYIDDVPEKLLAAFESLIVVASESLQHQTLAEAYRALALAARRMPRSMLPGIQGIVDRSLAALGEHVPTADLDDAITMLCGDLRGAGGNAAPLDEARERLRKSIGHLGSRSTRAE
jgi:uncharacterized membrane protein